MSAERAERAEFEAALDEVLGRVVTFGKASDITPRVDAVLAIFDRIVGERERDISQLAEMNRHCEEYAVERGALRAARDAAVEQAAHPQWHAFGCLVWTWLADHWDGEDGWDIAEMAVTAGLAERVKYDPAIHGECEADPGDEITYPLKGDPAFVNVAALRAEVAALTAERQRLELAAAEAMALVLSHEGHIAALTAANEQLRRAVSELLGHTDDLRDCWRDEIVRPKDGGRDRASSNMEHNHLTHEAISDLRAALAPRVTEGVK